MNLYNTLFGPLNVDFCNLFLVLMILALVFVITNVIALLYSFSNDRKLIPLFISNLIMSLFTYFLHRVLHSMCLVSLN
jgi:uncharacterized membrane protein YjjP (DUF1212 family)